jgi:hypothetical protein
MRFCLVPWSCNQTITGALLGSFPEGHLHYGGERERSCARYGYRL